jgi:hypothetical protein
MAATTGPIVAVGAITMANRSVFNNMPVDWRVPVATAIAAGLFSLAEKAIGGAAVALAWLALAAVVLTRVDPAVPSPAESAVKWFNER